MTRASSGVPLPSLDHIDQLVARGAARFPARPALQDGDALWTYRDLERIVATTCEGLAALGVRAGDRVLVVAENCAEVIALLFAIGRRDAWPVIVSSRLAPGEIEAIVGHCAPRLVLYLSARSDAAGDHATRRAGRALELAPIGTVHVERPAGEPVPEPPPARPEEGVAAMIYTSGTTGVPKAAMLSHANMLFMGAAQAAARRLGVDDKIYCPLPLSHAGALVSQLMSALTAGACLFLATRFAPVELARALRDEGITIVPGVPTLHVKFVAWARANPDAFAAPRLRLVICASSPLYPAVKADVEALYGMPVQNGYGLTETAAVVCQTELDAPRSDTSVGKPLPGVSVRFAGAGGAEAAPGDVGEIEVRGRNVFLGYYRNPEATRTAFTADGWFKTGDLGYADAAGNVFIAGRAKDLIKRSGYNVYPLDVETALNAHPAAAMCGVVGCPRGADEEVVAFVQLKEGAGDSAGDLLAFLAQRLAAWKLPGVLRIVPALPTLHNGKVDKAAMRRMALELPGD